MRSQLPDELWIHSWYKTIYRPKTIPSFIFLCSLIVCDRDKKFFNNKMKIMRLGMGKSLKTCIKPSLSLRLKQKNGITKYHHNHILKWLSHRMTDCRAIRNEMSSGIVTLSLIISLWCVNDELVSCDASRPFSTQHWVTSSNYRQLPQKWAKISTSHVCERLSTAKTAVW